MDADRARLLREPDDRVLDVGGSDHHQVGQLVDHAEHVGQRLLAAALAHLVHLDEVARARERHVGVALLHLAHEVLQRGRRLLRRRDHRREQVRDRVVVVELDLLGVDEHEADLVRRGTQQDRGEHRVHAARLARARGAGHEQVRHLREVGADRAPGHVLAEPDRERRPALGRRLHHVAEVHDPAAHVGDLDADRLLAGDRGEDADVRGGQRVREVVLELGDLADLDARRQAQLVAGDVRPRDHADHARLDAEVAERLDELGRDLLLPRRVGPVGLGGRAGEEARVRDGPDELRRVGHGAAQAALRREVRGRDVARAAHHAGLVGLGILGQARLGLAGLVGARGRGGSPSVSRAGSCAAVWGSAPVCVPRVRLRRRGPGSGRRPTRSRA